jgi:23S rRNA pseudouridine2605 synthase
MGVRVGSGDNVQLNGKTLNLVKRRVYVALHKPVGVISANSDPAGRPLAVDLLAGAIDQRVFHVGRLDMMSSGLLLFTNDGAFARIVSHPSSGIRKFYKVEASRAIADEVLEAYGRGVSVQGTRHTIVGWRRLSDRSVEVQLVEGHNREIRRVMEQYGIHLRRLQRTRIGIVSVRGLAPGQFRFLTSSEVSWFLRRRADPSGSSRGSRRPIRRRPPLT